MSYRNYKPDPAVEADFIRRINEAIAASAVQDKATRLHKAGEKFFCTTPQGWQLSVRLGEYVTVNGNGVIFDRDADIAEVAKRFSVAPPDGWPKDEEEDKEDYGN